MPQSKFSSLPTYVPGTSQKGGIKLSSNENPLGPSPLAMKAILNSDHQLHRYPDGSQENLRETLAKHYNLDKDNFIIGNGSDEILFLAALSFVEVGGEVFLAEHTFSQYRWNSLLQQAKPQTLPLEGGNINVNLLRKRINKNTQAIFLCHPNNPTGSVIPNLTQVVSSLPSHILVIIDEAYGEFAEWQQDYDTGLSLIKEQKNVLITRTFSKLYGLAACRVGYGIAHPCLIAQLNAVKPPFNVGLLEARAAEGALDDVYFVKKTQEIIFTEREKLSSLCKELGLFFYESKANFLCIRINPSFVTYCSSEKVSIRSLKSFGLPDYVRISIGTPEEMKKVGSLLRNFCASG